MHSLPIIGVLVAGIGGFIVIASWEKRAGRQHRATDILAYILLGVGISLFVFGVVS
jgi:hypothetical protein